MLVGGAGLAPGQQLVACHLARGRCKLGVDRVRRQSSTDATVLRRVSRMARLRLAWRGGHQNKCVHFIFVRSINIHGRNGYTVK
eukprot:SAG22_NODE_13095_length_419_cov_0.893750_1_plen_83_part_10